MTKRVGLGMILAVALTLVHIYVSQLSPNVASPLMLFDRLFDLALTALTGVTFLGVGQIGLRWLNWQSDSLAETLTLAFGIGAGVLSLLLLLLGFAQVLYVPVIVLVLLGAFFIARSEIWQLLAGVQKSWAQRVPLSRIELLLLVTLAALIVPSLIGALLPPTDVDALVYQLVAPQIFLRQHAVIARFDNIGVNYPLGLPMLFSFGLAAGSDIAAQMVHFLFALALTLGVYALAARYWSRPVGILAAVVFWTSAVVGLEASAPLLDLGWVLYEFLAVFAFLRWRETSKTRDLLLAGGFIGLAISNKYLAAIGMGVLAVTILVETVRQGNERLGRAAQNLGVFGLAAGLIAAPWYLKDWIWLGNPVYPFFFGSYGFDGLLLKPEGTLGLEGWVGYGVGNDLAALIQFPLNVYAHWAAFSAAYNRGGPSLLFWFLPFLLFVQKQPVLKWLVLFCVVRFAFWWPFTQNIRYLLVIFPWLAILVSVTIAAVMDRARRGRLLIAGAAALGCVLALLLQWGFAFLLRDLTIPFLSGQVSRDAFLAQNLRDYPSVRFMNMNLPAEAKVLAIGNARTFYARNAIVIDDSKDNWLKLLARAPNEGGVLNELQRLGITHVWFSEDDWTYVENYWDRDGRWKAARQALDQFTAQSLDRIYVDDDGYTVYALRADGR